MIVPTPTTYHKSGIAIGRSANPSTKTKCPEQDLNLHTFRHRRLNPTCFPVSPSGRCQSKNRGAASRSRTRDPLITNQQLYQLSYSGISKSNGALGRDRTADLAIIGRLLYQLSYGRIKKNKGQARQQGVEPRLQAPKARVLTIGRLANSLSKHQRTPNCTSVAALSSISFSSC